MRCALLTLALLSLAFAPAPFPRPSKPSGLKGDLKALQGMWQQIDAPAGHPADVVLTVAGDRFTFSRRGKVASDWTARLDPTKTPAALDLRNARPPGAGVVPEVLGVYVLQGDTLRFAYSLGGPGSRPAAVAAGPGVQLMSFRRSKK
jgi:uncharacterized protein (TIGR03067 family)